MMEWTDRHCRYFLRLITSRALLYTEMVTAVAVIHGDRDHLLSFHPAEHPVALQLGGSHPDELARAACIGLAYGYDEINLNVGCPSDRVQSGRFGACLMAEPGRVAECVAAMGAAVDVPVTVKCRIGIDDRDSYQELRDFAETVFDAGCDALIVHARKAWLTGLSPKENREIPPLRYGLVHALKCDFPGYPIVLNGGLGDLGSGEPHLTDLDGVMFGRAAYQQPYMLADVDRRFFGCTRLAPSRADVVHRLIPYADAHLADGGRLQQIARHVIGLFHGRPGGRLWRRSLSENATRAGADSRVLLEALEAVAKASGAGGIVTPTVTSSGNRGIEPLV